MGLKVVATDFDEKSLVKLQSKLKNENISISLMDICRPTPAIGWNNMEHISFLQKAKNYFGLVLCLGLVHHLLITERIPLIYILETLNSLTKKYLLVEWIHPEDAKFIQISKFNKDLSAHFTTNFFESIAKTKFSIIKKINLINRKKELLSEKNYRTDKKNSKG